MATARKHTKPAVPKEQREAEKVARQMYAALTAPGAPKATPAGYIMGACKVLEILLKQAVQQGANKEDLKLYATQFIHAL